MTTRIEILPRKPKRPKGLVSRAESDAAIAEARATKTPAERLRHRQIQKVHRPWLTAWETADGAWIVQRGRYHDGTKVRTGQCPQCSRWFRVSRPANSRARWLRYCSPECSEAAQRGSKRRRRAEGVVQPRNRVYRFTSFDPDDPDAYWIAQDIVGDPSPKGSPTKVFNAAYDYLEELDRVIEQEAIERAERERDEYPDDLG